MADVQAKGLFDGFTAPVNSQTDKRYLRHQRKRLRTFSKPPFKSDSIDQETDDSDSDSPSDEWNDKPVGKRPPSWLALSGDLAWTATFASLTSNTDISTPRSVISYGVFFTMAWQLWASQANYDIRFYTDDWWHRIFFILQLTVYGGLASFTADFDVLWGLSPDGEDVFVGDVDQNTAQAIVRNRMRTKELSFLGIALMLAISRLLLLIQHGRVLYYRRRQQNGITWRYMLTPITLTISMVLFFICFGILKSVNLSLSRPAAIAQLFLWASAMVIEIVGQACTKDEDKQKLIGRGSITGRLSTLTVIVLGEGLNGLCSTLRHSVNSLGFGANNIAEITSVAFVLYFVWLLYFGAFKKRLNPNGPDGKIWIILHLPFHLCLILLLEGLKNTLLYNNLLLGSHYFITTLCKHVNTADGFLPSSQMEKALQKLDMSWTQQLIESNAAFKTSKEAGYMQFWRWTLQVMYKLLSRYEDNLDPQIEARYHTYMNEDNYVKQDLVGSDYGERGYYGQYWVQVVKGFEEPLQDGTAWVLPVAGAVIMCIGLLNFFQRRPQDKYAWGSFLNKFIAGLVLIGLAGFSKAVVAGKKDFGALLWFMPIIAITYSLVAFVDLILLLLLNDAAPKEKTPYSSIEEKQSKSPDSKSLLRNMSIDSGDSSLPKSPSSTFSRRSKY